ncbi:MAG: tetratricopeptide repeat protein [Thermotogota bacterium]
MKFLKKGLVVLLLILTTVSFSGELDNFLYNFTPGDMLESESDEMKYMGHLLVKWEKGYEPIKNTQDLDLNFTEDEQAVIDFLENLEEYVFIAPLKELDQMKKDYQDSLIFNSFYLFFGSEYWKQTKDPSYAVKMFDTAEKIEDMVGEKVPLTIYYDSYIAWHSRVYSDKERAFEDIKYGFLNFKKEKTILELYIKISYSYNYFEYLDTAYQDYMGFDDKNFNTVLTLANSYRVLGDIEKTKEIAQYVIDNSTSTFTQRDAFEILGDLSETQEEKIEYYKQASSIDPENWKLLRKLGMAYYNQDPEENAQLARAMLNMSITQNPNQPEVEIVLDELRRKVIIHNIINYVLPIIAVFALGVFLLLRHEKKKKKKEKDMIYHESREDHKDHNDHK